MGTRQLTNDRLLLGWRDLVSLLLRAHSVLGTFLFVSFVSVYLVISRNVICDGGGMNGPLPFVQLVASKYLNDEGEMEALTNTDFSTIGQ